MLCRLGSGKLTGLRDHGGSFGAICYKRPLWCFWRTRKDPSTKIYPSVIGCSLYPSIWANLSTCRERGRPSELRTKSSSMLGNCRPHKFKERQCVCYQKVYRLLRKLMSSQSSRSCNRHSQPHQQPESQRLPPRADSKRETLRELSLFRD